MWTVVPGMRNLAGCGLLLGAALLTAGCAAQPGAAAAPSSTPSGPSGPGAEAPDGTGLVLQVAYAGGYTTPEMNATQLPLVAVYADGRVLTQGPVAAIYPGPALPNVLQKTVAPARVQELVQQALDAGVGRDVDYGEPAVADVPSTVITLVTSDGTLTTEVPALQPGSVPEGDAGGLTDGQAAAREPIAALVDDLVAAGTGGEQPYEPEAVAAVATGYPDPEMLPQPEEVAWPGPPLPGEPLEGGLGLTCVTARGEAADAVLAAAADAAATTPWTDSAGTRWSLVLRPLLPHETGCADLGG